MTLSKALTINHCPVPKVHRQTEALESRALRNSLLRHKAKTWRPFVLILYYLRAMLHLLWKSSFAVSEVLWFPLPSPGILGSKPNTCLGFSAFLYGWAGWPDDLWGLSWFWNSFFRIILEGRENREMSFLVERPKFAATGAGRAEGWVECCLPECIWEQKANPFSWGLEEKPAPCIKGSCHGW